MIRAKRILVVQGNKELQPSLRGGLIFLEKICIMLYIYV